MRLAGRSSVVMASTIVDLPEPMSPVSSPLWPPAWKLHVRLSNVPQFRSSSCSSRKPLSCSAEASGISAEASGISVEASGIGVISAEQRGVFGQPPVEVGQPLAVDECLENAPHLE